MCWAMCVMIVGCRSSATAPAPEERPPVEPPPGWRIGRLDTRNNMYRATFVPKQRTYQEKLWVAIARNPPYLAKSTDELFDVFKPIFICQNKDVKFLKKEYGDIIFEEKDSDCYGRRYRLTIGRIARGHSTVSFYGYRADQLELPAGDRDFVIKALSSAPLEVIAAADTASSPLPPSVAPGASPKPTTASH